MRVNDRPKIKYSFSAVKEESKVSNVTKEIELSDYLSEEELKYQPIKQLSHF